MNKNIARFQCGDVARWRDYVNAHFPQLDLCTNDAALFRSAISASELGGFGFSFIRTRSLVLERSRRLVRSAEPGYIKVIWQLEGLVKLEQDDRACDLDAGDIAVCDTTRPYRLDIPGGARHAILMLPHALDRRLSAAARSQCATRLSDQSAWPAALGAITAMLNRTDTAALSDVDTVMYSLTHMLVQALLGAGQCGDDYLDAARRYIRQHVAEAGLTPDRLAQGLNMSRRSLYIRLAQSGTTPSRLITEVRLEHARCQLANSQGDERMIDIAYASGFNDSAHFSRTFKQHFGDAPSRWRTRAGSNG